METNGWTDGKRENVMCVIWMGTPHNQNKNVNIPINGRQILYFDLYLNSQLKVAPIHTGEISANFQCQTEQMITSYLNLMFSRSGFIVNTSVLDVGGSRRANPSQFIQFDTF